MKTLNLVDLDKSDIKYKISKFPDGQQNIVINTMFINSIKLITVDSKINSLFAEDFPVWKEPVQIKSRLNNWLDLELITCTVASLRELGVEEIHLYTPYIMGARSDRKFEEGGNNYLKDVICPIINSLNFKTVTCIDPHSDVLEACIKGFRKQSNKILLENALFNIQTGIYSGMLNKLEYLDKFILVSPDAGASKKIYKLAEQIGYKGDIITCSKNRDENGKLTKTIVPLKAGEYPTQDFIIIDDICDGGATFINIAKELKEIRTQYSKQKIYLIVTHGIFSKGFEELSKYFDGIYCTNSYGDALSQRDGDVMYEKLVKQLNVF